MRKLGLIGGLGPIATVHYYKALAEEEAGEMLIIHADMPFGLRFAEQGDLVGLARYLAGLIERLARGGAEVAAISAVTPHICIRELQKITPLPLVSIVDAVKAEVLARGYKRVVLFGTKFVVESRLFGMLDGVDVMVPDQVGAIHEAYMQAVRGDPGGRPVLLKIAHELPVDAILLAGTDLALIFDQSNTDFPHVDCAKVHIEAILRELR